MTPLDRARDQHDEARALADLADTLADGFLAVQAQADAWAASHDARAMIRRIVRGPTADPNTEETT